MSRACDLYVPINLIKLQVVEYALNALGAHLRHASVCYMCVPISLDVASVACPISVCETHIELSMRVCSAW